MRAFIQANGKETDLVAKEHLLGNMSLFRLYQTEKMINFTITTENGNMDFLMAQESIGKKMVTVPVKFIMLEV